MSSPRGGTYMVTVYVDRATGAEVDKAGATGALASEYDAEDHWLGETVLDLVP